MGLVAHLPDHVGDNAVGADMLEVDRGNGVTIKGLRGVFFEGVDPRKDGMGNPGDGRLMRGRACSSERPAER